MKLPKGWEEKELVDLVKTDKFSIVDGPFGTQLHTCDYVSKGIPLIRIKNISRYNKFDETDLVYITEKKFRELKRSSVYPNDILLAKTGATIGKVCLLPKKINKALIASSCAKISIDKKKAIPKYVMLFLSTGCGQKQILKSSSGSTRKSINLTPLKKLKIPIPYPNNPKKSLRIQDQIVSILSRAEKLKEKRKQANELLKQLPQSIFLKMFGGPYETELLVKELAEICEKITDGSHNTPKILDEGYPFLTVANMGEPDFDYEGCKRISKEDYEKLVRNGCKPLKGDVLFSKDGTVGKVMEITNEKEQVLLSSIAILRPDKKKILSTFLAEYLKTDYALKQAIGKKSGSAIRRVVLKDIKTIKIPLPPLSKQKQLAKKVKLVYALKKQQKQSEQEINMLFDSLLQKAFKGGLVS